MRPKNLFLPHCAMSTRNQKIFALLFLLLEVAYCQALENYQHDYGHYGQGGGFGLSNGRYAQQNGYNDFAQIPQSFFGKMARKEDPYVNPGARNIPTWMLVVLGFQRQADNQGITRVSETAGLRSASIGFWQLIKNSQLPTDIAVFVFDDML